MLSKKDTNAWSESKKDSEIHDQMKVEKWPKLERIKSHGQNSSEPRPHLGLKKNKAAVDNERDILKQPNNLAMEKTEDIHVPSASTFSKPSRGDASEIKKGDMCFNSKEEKKLAHKAFAKMKKDMCKQEKQRKKEIEYIKNMVAPKDLRVTMINNKTFTQFTKNEVRNDSNADLIQTKKIDLAAFPDLSPSSNKANCNPIGAQKSKRNNFSRSLWRDAINHSEINIGVVKSLPDPNSDSPKKQRKRKDPVVVDILKALEICQSEKKSSKVNMSPIDFKRKEKNSYVNLGNILDSSNPMRHRGKKRELPKKRNMTKLKKSIMAEREKRKGEFRRKHGTLSSGTEKVVEEIELNIGKMSSLDLNDSVKSNEHVPPINEELFTSSIYVSELEMHKEEHQNTAVASEEVFDVDKMVRESMHSRKFREYCNHSKSKELTEASKLMLKDILRFQDRLHVNQPIKAESHRRYVVGLRQTQNLLSAQKVKIVILATDMEPVTTPGGLNDVVYSIIDRANKQSIPVVFPLLRRELGKATYRKVGVSCVGILNYQGTEANYERLMSALKDARQDYLKRFEIQKSEINEKYGLKKIKKELEEETISVEPVKAELSVTLPFFQKLTEAISEVCLKKSVQNEEDTDL